MIDKSKIPEEALTILKTLRENGFQSFLVGGCVRDLCLGKEPKDYDITTSALPEQIISIFSHTIPTGIKHGTVTVMINNFPIEVTTFRSDGNYSDGRRPDSVKLGVTVEEDVKRRDFRINGLLYDGEKIIDYVNGKIEFMLKRIRCIGFPDDRFQEDALRMMRAIRFACQLGFTIEKETFTGIIINSDKIVNVSQERIRDELCKILLSDRPVEGIKLLEKSGLLQYILPELHKCVGFDQHNYHHRKNVFEHILKVLDATPCSLNIRLAALLHDIAKPETFSIDENGVGHFYSHHIVGAEMSEKILKRLKFDNQTVNDVKILIKEHMARYPNLRKQSFKKLINRLGEHNIDDFINLQLADIIGSKPPFNFEGIIDLQREIKQVLEAKEPLSVKDLAVNGHDLIELGIKPGKRMGEILNDLLEMVLEKPDLNIKEKLIGIAKQYL